MSRPSGRVEIASKNPNKVRYWAWAGAGVLLAWLLVFSRRPDAFLNPQFWAEDGVVWYRQAYEIGWRTLLLPQNGYFQTVSKLTGMLSQLVSLAWAPLVFNGVATIFTLLPVLVINSERGRRLLPDTAARLFISFLYLAHPYSWEVHVNVTNIHWHLALATLLLICFDDWQGGWRKLFDLSLTALCGLSGIFSLFLAPIAAWRWYRLRNRHSLILAVVLGLAASIQLAAIVMTRTGTRSPAPLDASWAMLLKIFGGQVIAAGLLGEAWAKLFAHPWWQSAALLPLLLSGLGAMLFARVFVKSDDLLRGLILLAGMIFVAALMSPQISSTQGQWPLFSRPGVGGRYVFIPIVALYASLLWMATKDPLAACRWMGRSALLLVLVIAIPASWKMPPYKDLHFSEHAAMFEAAAPGEVVKIPINPGDWSVILRKKEN